MRLEYRVGSPCSKFFQLLTPCGALWGRFLARQLGAASLVSLAPAGGEGLGEGEGMSIDY
jgi:hypothetical protein